MNKLMIVPVMAALNVTACGGKHEMVKVEAMQGKDKRLSCEDILLEMNEADFHRQVAHKNKGPKLKNILLPLGYISTYMDAEEAITAAEARVSYLDQIYSIMRCEDQDFQSVQSPQPQADMAGYSGYSSGYYAMPYQQYQPMPVAAPQPQPMPYYGGGYGAPSMYPAYPSHPRY